MHLSNKRTHAGIVIFLIFLVGFCLRLAFALNYLPLLGDEEAHLVVARSISFSFKNFCIPLENVLANHLILADLPVKWGITIFGENPLGTRFFFVLIGWLNLILVYKLLVKYSKEAAVYGLLLLALNQFHIGHSGIADNTVIFLFFSTLSIYVFWKGITTTRSALWLLGPIWVLTYFTQEQIVIFAPAFYLFLLVSSKYRAFSLSKEIIFAYSVFLGFVLFHLLYIKFIGTSLEYYTVPGYIQFSFIPTLTGVNFFLIKIICKILNLDYLMTVNWEAPLMSILSGVVLFSGIIYSLKNLKSEFTRLLFLLTASQLLIFTFIATETFFWGEPDWAKLSLIPAICLAALMLAKLKKRFNGFKYAIYAIFIFMFFQALIFSFQPKPAYPPHRFASFVDYDTSLIELYTGKEFLGKPSRDSLEKIGVRPDHRKAMDDCLKALEICPNEVRIHNYLAESLYKSGLIREAEDEWLMALELEPFFKETFVNILSVYTNRESSFYKNIIHLSNGVQCLRYEMNDEAIKEFKEAELESPHRALIYYYLGAGYLYNGDIGYAENATNKALALNPGFMQAYLNLARIFMLRNMPNDAEKILRKTIQINPDFPPAYIYLGRISADKGRQRFAKDYYKQAEGIIHVTLKGYYNASKLFSEKNYEGN